MAERWAVATGNWSNTSTWNGGTLPTSADDVYSNGFAVTINQNVTVLSLRTTAGSTAVAGGNFEASTTVTITLTGAGFVGGSVVTIGFTFFGTSPTVCTFTGNVQAGAATGLRNSSSGTLNITGNVIGGNGANARGVWGSSTGSTTINGNVTGGSASGAIGADASSSGNLTINGLVTGGSASTAYGASSQSSGLLTINNGTSNAVVGGSVSNTAYGAYCVSTSRFAITGHVVASAAARAIMLVSTATGNTIVGNVIGAASRGLEFAGSAVGASLTVTGNVWCTNAAVYGIAMLNANGTLTINGNILPNVGSSILLSATGLTIVVNGSVTGGTGASCRGIYCNTGSTSGTITVNGTATGGSNTSAFGIETQTEWTITVQNAVGGSASTANGVRMNGTSIVNVSQNTTGGSALNADGVSNQGAGTVNVSGNAKGGSGTTARGVNNASTGTVNVLGLAIGADTTGGVGVFNASTGLVTIGGAQFGAQGWPPYAGIVYFADLNAATLLIERSDGVDRTLRSGAFIPNYSMAGGLSE